MDSVPIVTPPTKSRSLFFPLLSSNLVTLLIAGGVVWILFQQGVIGMPSLEKDEMEVVSPASDGLLIEDEDKKEIVDSDSAPNDAFISSNQSVRTLSEVDISPSWATYSNDIHGFSFRYPQDLYEFTYSQHSAPSLPGHIWEGDLRTRNTADEFVHMILFDGGNGEAIETYGQLHLNASLVSQRVVIVDDYYATETLWEDVSGTNRTPWYVIFVTFDSGETLWLEAPATPIEDAVLFWNILSTAILAKG